MTCVGARYAVSSSYGDPNIMIVMVSLKVSLKFHEISKRYLMIVLGISAIKTIIRTNHKQIYNETTDSKQMFFTMTMLKNVGMAN